MEDKDEVRRSIRMKEKGSFTFKNTIDDPIDLDAEDGDDEGDFTSRPADSRKKRLHDAIPREPNDTLRDRKKQKKMQAVANRGQSETEPIASIERPEIVTNSSGVKLILPKKLNFATPSKSRQTSISNRFSNNEIDSMSGEIGGSIRDTTVTPKKKTTPDKPKKKTPEVKGKQKTAPRKDIGKKSRVTSKIANQPKSNKKEKTCIQARKGRKAITKSKVGGKKQNEMEVVIASKEKGVQNKSDMSARTRSGRCNIMKKTTVDGSSVKRKMAKRVVAKSINKKKTKTNGTVRIRTTPRPLLLGIKSLNDAQKKAVEDMGFGRLLDMKTDYIPSRLAYYLLNNLDTSKMELTLSQGTIKLKPEMVHDVLGTPIGGVNIYFTEPAPKGKNVKHYWRRQFPGIKVRISEVQRKIEGSRLADLQFKLNFLMLFLSTMAECNSCGYVIPGVLSYIKEDTDISSIDWSRYVLDCLGTSKDVWKIDSDTYYSGPITFLTLLYASITECSGFTVDRSCPAICFWNTDYLRRRESQEMQAGGFGTFLFVNRDTTNTRQSARLLSNERDEIPFEAADYDNVANDTSATEMSSRRTDSDQNEMQSNRQDLTLKIYKDVMRVFLDTLASTKEKATTTIENAISSFPFDIELRLMLIELKNMFNESVDQKRTSGQGDDVADSDPMEVDSDIGGTNVESTLDVFNNVTPVKQQGTVNVTSDVGSQMVVFSSIQDTDDLDSPTTQFKIDRSIEEYHRRKRFESCSKDMPSFDLFIDSPEKNLPTPKPLSTIHPKCGMRLSFVPTMKALVGSPKDTKREKYVSRWLRSPYKQRCVDLLTPENSTEKKIVGWINACVEPVCEHVFKTSTGCTALRGSMESLCARTHIFCHAIDSWAALLNHEEQDRSHESPRRFFMNTSILSEAMIDASVDYELKFKMFYSNILSAFDGDVNATKMKEVDLLFFPIVKDLHFYVVVFNLKHPSFVIIDNLEHKLDEPTMFEEIPDTLHLFLTDHMERVNHPAYKELSRLSAVKIAVKWFTKINTQDCGVFLMRHMECYKGQIPYKWNIGLDVEGRTQTKQLQTLRHKYTAKILLSDINLLRSYVIDRCERFNDLDMKEKTRLWAAADAIREKRLASI